jgi:hypothetical protein
MEGPLYKGGVEKTRIVVRSAIMSGPFDKELESIANQHTQDFARKLAYEVQNLILRKLGIEPGAAAVALRPASPAVPAASRSSAPPKKVVKAPAAAPAKAAPAAAPAKAAPAAKKVAPAAPKKRANGEDKASTLDKVFRIVQGRDGVAVSDIVKATSLDRGPVAAALKTLKEDGKIFMGGNRRFARYAMSQAAADRASMSARKGA